MSKTSNANINAAADSAAAPAAAVVPEILTSMTPDQVSDAIKGIGCAVTAFEQEGVTRLHSAAHGVGFQVLWGNALAAGLYADFTLSCPLRVQGGVLPEGLLGEWYRTKRFARVAQHGDFVVLEMDVIVAGGVNPAHIQLSLQLWTQMMGQFFLFLRSYTANAAAAAVDAGAEAKVEAVADAV
ncbi:MAG TPA: YbjN domain-containing protein [Herbaspirillum sp.]|jgi:hypothetical protein